MGNLDYNVTDEVVNDFKPLPVGEYLASITSAEMMATAKGGSMIQLKFEIMDGEYQGRWVSFINIQWTNGNKEPVAFGHRQLNTLLQAIGYAVGQGIQDTAELTGNAVVVDVGIEQDKNGQYAPKNVVKNYYAPNGAVPAAVSQAAPETVAQAQQQAPAPAQSDAKPSWAS